MPSITPSLWFDQDLEEAAEFYTSVFPNSRIEGFNRTTQAGPGEPGTVLSGSFVLDGTRFIGINGGPEFTFDEAISFQVNCESQEEIDEFWAKLSDGGQEGPCGWLKDRFGLSWQIVPTLQDELLRDPDVEKAQRAMKAVLGMGKIDIAEVQRAVNEG